MYDLCIQISGSKLVQMYGIWKPDKMWKELKERCYEWLSRWVWTMLKGEEIKFIGTKSNKNNNAADDILATYWMGDRY